MLYWLLLLLLLLGSGLTPMSVTHVRHVLIGWIVGVEPKHIGFLCCRAVHCPIHQNTKRCTAASRLLATTYIQEARRSRTIVVLQHECAACCQRLRIIPQRHDQHHSSVQGLSHCLQPALPSEVIDISKGCLHRSGLAQKQRKIHPKDMCCMQPNKRMHSMPCS